jgi:ABC-2 type transport system permease protein
MRPVRRTRLLVAKALVAGTLIWACVAVVAVSALAVGLVTFGWHPVTIPAVVGATTRAAFQIATGTLILRVAITAAYIAFGFTALLALGTFFSTLTDTPTGAIGAGVGVYIVSEILDGITSLGVVRYAFPTHYLDAWQTMFTANTYSREMVVGIAVQLAYLVVFGAAAAWWFGRKDIRS